MTGRVMGLRRASVHNHRDANEPMLLGALEQAKIQWVEAGPLDGWINLLGSHVPVEIKNPEGFDTMTAVQQAYLDLCDTNNWVYFIWRTLDDMVESINLFRKSKAWHDQHGRRRYV